MSELTQVLYEARNGTAGAAEKLAERLYEELREVARREMAGERADHTLQPTAVVHEAYLRLVGPEEQVFENRAHFFGAAARAIRRVLVEHARKRARIRRGGGAARLDLDAHDPAAPARDANLLGLDEGLEHLAQFDATKARIVELRFFAGMSVEEVAQALHVSESTVARGWRLARAWLRSELEDSRGP